MATKKEARYSFIFIRMRSSRGRIFIGLRFIGLYYPLFDESPLELHAKGFYYLSSTVTMLEILNIGKRFYVIGNRS